MIIAVDGFTMKARNDMSGGVIIPDKETAKKLNELARHKQIVRLLADITADMTICELEGWDRMEYINMLKGLINSLGTADTPQNERRAEQCV